MPYKTLTLIGTLLQVVVSRNLEFCYDNLRITQLLFRRIVIGSLTCIGSTKSNTRHLRLNVVCEPRRWCAGRPAGSRTHNLLIESPTPRPLGHHATTKHKTFELKHKIRPRLKIIQHGYSNNHSVKKLK